MTWSLFHRVHAEGISPGLGSRCGDVVLRSAMRLDTASLLIALSMLIHAARAPGFIFDGGSPKSRSRRGSSGSA